MSANYVKSVEDAQPIKVYQDTDEHFAEFAHGWTRYQLEELRKVEDDFDFDDLRHKDGQLIKGRWINRTEDVWKFAAGYAGYGSHYTNGKPDSQLVVFQLPKWFAGQEFGDWDPFWFGTFEVAKEDDNGDWTAVCFSNIERLANRREDNYFRNPIEEKWIPVSLMEQAFAVVPEKTEDNLIIERGLDSSEFKTRRGQKDEADIVVSHRVQTQYGAKWAVDSPFEAKDDIKGLDWEQFHPSWDGDQWTFDLNSLWSFVEKMTEQGWTVCVAENVERLCDSDSLSDDVYLPEEITEVK